MKVNKTIRNLLAKVHLECFAALGSLVEYNKAIPEAKTLPWTDEEIRRMVNEMKRRDFSEAIPYIDSFPSILFDLDGHKIKDFQVTHDEYLSRIKRFVNYAHNEKIKVSLYFPVGVGAVAIGPYEGNSMSHSRKWLLGYEVMEHFPNSFTYDQNGISSWDRLVEEKDGIAFMSLAYSEVRSYLADLYVTVVEKTGADGLQLEPVAMPTDKNGVCIYGYEEPIVNTFGGKPKKNDDPEWIAFRGNFALEFVREVRKRLLLCESQIELSTVDYSLKDDYRYLWPWRKMVKEKLIDAFYFRTTSLENLQERIMKAKEICRLNNPSCRFVGCLDIKSYSQFTDAKKILRGIREVLESGVQSLGIYGLRWTEPFHNPKERDLDIWNKVVKKLKGGRNDYAKEE